MVLGKLPVPGHPAGLDSGRTRAYCAFDGCGCRFFGRFCSRILFLFILLLWETARYRLKCCLKGR